MKLRGVNPKHTQLLLIVLNAVLFQIAWFVCVLDRDPFGWLATIFVVGVHLALVAGVHGPAAGRRELLWLFAVVFLGWLVELVFVSFGQLLHEPRTDSLFGVPFWLLLLWLAFGTTFRFSLMFLRDKNLLAALVGLSAVLSYWAGAAINDTAEVGMPLWLNLGAIALVWAVVLPALVKLHQRYVL